MKKKKNLTKIIGLAMLLIVCVGGLIMWVNYTVNQNVVSCYIAKTNVEPYTTINNSNFLNYFEETTIHKTMYENLKNPVTSKDQIINQETKTLIVKGYPLDSSLFQKKTNANYKGIVDPVKITLPVESEKNDPTILQKGKTVTMIGYMNSTSSVTDDQGNKVKDDAWVGILTNNAIVYSVKTDKNASVESATFIVESAVYPSLLMMSENYSIFFLEGSLNDISDSKSDIVKDLYNQTGTAAGQNFSITNTNLTFDTQEVKSNIPTYFATGKDENYVDYQTDIGVKQKVSYFTLSGKEGLDITWTGATSSAFIYHYNIDGSRGARYGLYTKTSKDTSTSESQNNKTSYLISYNSVTCENSFPQLISEAGFYQIIFDIKNPNYGQKKLTAAGIEVDEPLYIHKIINFVITETLSATINLNTTGNEIVYDRTVYNTSKLNEYFKKVPLMKGYSEAFNFESNTEINTRAFVSSNNHYLPLFDKTKQTTINNSNKYTDEQYTNLKLLFGVQDEQSTVQTAIKYIIEHYNKEQIDDIINTLNNNCDGLKDYTESEKWIILYSLGCEVNDKDIIKGIIAVLEKSDDSVTPKLEITFNNGGTISFDISINSSSATQN